MSINEMYAQHDLLGLMLKMGYGKRNMTPDR